MNPQGISSSRRFWGAFDQPLAAVVAENSSPTSHLAAPLKGDRLDASKVLQVPERYMDKIAVMCFEKQNKQVFSTGK